MKWDLGAWLAESLITIFKWLIENKSNLYILRDKILQKYPECTIIPVNYRNMRYFCNIMIIIYIAATDLNVDYR